MPRSLPVRIILVVVVVVAALILLSRIDATKAPRQVVKVIPDNALAR